MGIGDGDQAGSYMTNSSDGFLYSLLAAEAIRVFFLIILSSVPDGGSMSGALGGAWLLTILAVPTLGYLDLRRLRTAGHWEPRAKGSFWVFGMLIPFIGTSVVIAYVLRRRELMAHHGAWGGWVYVTGVGIAVLTLSIIGFPDQSVEEDTVWNAAAVIIFVSLILLPSLATYFDLRYLRRTWGRDLSLKSWLWAPIMHLWFFQIVFFIVYVYWRKKISDDKEWADTIKKDINEANSQLEEGVSALENSLYDSALSCFDRAEQSLSNANTTVEEFVDTSSADYSKHVEKVVSDINEIQQLTEFNRSRTEAAIELEAGLDALNDDDLESAIDSFETAIDQAEGSLDIIDEQDDTTEKIRTILLRAREELDATLEKCIEENIIPLEEQIEAAYGDGVSVLEAGDYDEAADRLSDADSYLNEFDTLVRRYDLGRDPPVGRDDVADKIDRINKRRIVSEELDPLASRIELLYENGVSALEAGSYEEAIEHFEEAEGTTDRFQEVQADYSLECDSPITSDEIVDQIDDAERKRDQAAIESRLDHVDRLRKEGRSAMNKREYDRAVDALESARQELEKASSLVAEESLNEWDLDERHSTLNELYETAVTEREKQRYRDSKEHGETLLDEAITAADEGNYADAIRTCNKARKAFEEAQIVAEESSDVDGAEIEDRLEEVSGLLSDCRIQELSERVTDARVPVGEGDREQYLAAAGNLDELVAELDAQDINRDRDLAILREEAESERFKALLLAERERVQAAIEAFQNGEYRTARDDFEAAQAAVADIRASTEESGITDYNEVIDQLESTCEQNATATRRGALGIDDDPTVVPITIALGEESESGQPPGKSSPQSDDSVASPVASGVTDLSALQSGSASVNDALLDALPVSEVSGHIGSGGNADVYDVRLDSGERAALKVPRWQGTLSTTLIEAFENEAETWSKLDEHDSIVSVIDWDNEPLPWLLLEYLPASLADRMDSLSVASAISILVDVADASEFAHSRGVIHLDIKPENILLTDTDAPKVGDWGLSQIVLSHTRTRMGLTPPYSAPEQLTDEYGDIDRRTDIYQLSVLAYRVLTGQLPFDAERPVDLQQQILSDGPTPASTVNPALNPAIDDVLAKGLAKNPADRYEAAVLFRNAISSLAE